MLLIWKSGPPYEGARRRNRREVAAAISGDACPSWPPYKQARNVEGKGRVEGYDEGVSAGPGSAWPPYGTAARVMLLRRRQWAMGRIPIARPLVRKYWLMAQQGLATAGTNNL